MLYTPIPTPDRCLQQPQGYTPYCLRELSGAGSHFLNTYAFFFAPVTDPALSARASLLGLFVVMKSLMGTCGHSNCLFIFDQGSGSFSNPVDDL